MGEPRIFLNNADYNYLLDRWPEMKAQGWVELMRWPPPACEIYPQTLERCRRAVLSTPPSYR